jgi:hypothetical protein
MALETLRTTVYTTPAPNTGGSACSPVSATSGTGDPQASCTSSSVVAESVEWRTWQTAQNATYWSSVALKVEWSIDLLTDGCCVTKRVRLEYSTNNGSTWGAFSGFPKTPTASGSSGTASAAIAVSQDRTKLRVRMVVESSADSPCEPNPDPPPQTLNCFCRTQGIVSDVRLEATYTIGSGACCNGDSCSVRSQAQCTGTYRGDGTTCSPNPCVTGACCTGSSNQNCSVRAQGDCTGIFHGANTTCSPVNPCTNNQQRACCVSAACSLRTQSECAAVGGVWRSDKISCTPNPCEVTGACCAGSVCVTRTESDCTAGGFIFRYWGDNTFCTTAPNAADCTADQVCGGNVGACCIDDTCRVTSKCWCVNAGGYWIPNTNCSRYPCNRGNGGMNVVFFS